MWSGQVRDGSRRRKAGSVFIEHASPVELTDGGRGGRYLLPLLVAASALVCVSQRWCDCWLTLLREHGLLGSDRGSGEGLGA